MTLVRLVSVTPTRTYTHESSVLPRGDKITGPVGYRDTFFVIDIGEGKKAGSYGLIVALM